MFRWLKDRNKKTRKSSTGSARSKEDDYGFKQNAPGECKSQTTPEEYKTQTTPGEYKRDLPPTPADLMTSCSIRAVTSASGDDDRSVHIYEEIPDLPFRCTPEGELRIVLAQEAATASKKATKLARSATPPLRQAGSLAGTRNISPYMVVPLEFRGDHNHSAVSGLRCPHNLPEDVGGSAPPLACAVVGRKRVSDTSHQHQQAQQPSGLVASSPSWESTCSPISCCSSSVFGSTLDGAGGCGSAGGDGGDISDRLLNAINLTRLLAAVRLSSSSADTCTTSPICIGVDKDGRNISVSVSVTPTSACGSNNLTINNSSHSSQLHHQPHTNDNDDGLTTTGDIEILASESTGQSASTCRQEVTVSATEAGLASTASKPPASSAGQESSVVALKAQHSSVLPSHSSSSDGTLLNSSVRLAGSTSSSSSASTAKPESERHRHHQTGLRFLPSPLEQNALSEILQLRPGETTELDPAAIDALLLKLCSHTLHSDGALSEGKVPFSSLAHGSSLQRHELDGVERMLKEMVRQGETEEDSYHQPPAISSSASTSALYSRRRHHHRQRLNGLSPGGVRKRAENSDTGFEYDVSTSSESDHTNYDYFLSKVARTRSLECEVKKLIRSSDSSQADSDDDDEEDDEEDDGEEDDDEEDTEEKGVSCGQGGAGDVSLSTVSEACCQRNGGRQRYTRPAKGGHVRSDSDDGMMADLSESENSSGYYEPVASQVVNSTASCTTPTPTPATPQRASWMSARLCSHGKKRKLSVTGPAQHENKAQTGGHTSRDKLGVSAVPTNSHGKNVSSDALSDDGAKIQTADGACDCPADGGGRTGPPCGLNTGPSCGAEDRKLNTGPLCGAEDRKLNTGPLCGVEDRKKKRVSGGGPYGDRKTGSLSKHSAVASERRKALLYGTTTTARGRNNPSANKEGELGQCDLELQCYELYYSGADSYEGYDPTTTARDIAGPVSQESPDSGSPAGCLAQIYAPLSDLQRSMTAPHCLSAPRPSRHAHHLPRSSSGSAKGKKCRSLFQSKHSADNISPAPADGVRESRKDSKKSTSTNGKKARDPSRARGSHARSSSLGDRVGDSRSGGECQLRRGSADAASLGRRRSGDRPVRSTRPNPVQSAVHTASCEFTYSFLYHSPSSIMSPTTTPTNSNVGNPSSRALPFRPPPSDSHVTRTASFHSEYHKPAPSKAGDNNTVYESGRETSDVYSLADGSAGDGGGSRSSVPSKLSVARQVPESSEVYGTRAGLLGSNNRLLSDLILLNYNLHM